MGAKGLEIRAENLDFFLKEVHALFRQDNPLRDVEETRPNFVSLSLSLFGFCFVLFHAFLPMETQTREKGDTGEATTHVSSLTRFHALCGRGQCFRSDSYATIL